MLIKCLTIIFANGRMFVVQLSQLDQMFSRLTNYIRLVMFNLHIMLHYLVMQIKAGLVCCDDTNSTSTVRTF